MINKKYEFLTTVALIDSSADSNYIHKRMIPTKFIGKTTERLHQESGTKLTIDFKLSNTHVCNNIGICIN